MRSSSEKTKQINEYEAHTFPGSLGESMSSSLKKEYKTVIQQDIADSATGVMRRPNNVSHYQQIFQVCTLPNCKVLVYFLS